MTQRGMMRIAIGVLIVTVGLVACTRQDSDVSPGVADVRQSRTDAELTTAVQGQFYADDLARAERVDVDARDGVVTLSGTVESDAAHMRVLEIARGVPGVTRVEDGITVEPARTQSEPAGRDVPPQAGTRAGGDTRETARSRPSAVARDAQEVFDAANPAWITTKIQAAYFVDPDVKPWNIDVTTRSGGIVELHGEVEDERSKDEAVRIARGVDGVTSVEDRLRIEGAPDQDAAAAPHDGAENNPFSDVWLTTKVQSKYYLDDEIRGRDIDVTTEDRVTTLTGMVASEAERRRAVALAQNTNGVREVRDQLRVESDEAASRPSAPGALETTRAAGDTIEDVWITTKIQSQYFLDSDVKGHEIDVDTKNGVVTLTGTVASEESKEAAEAIARDTEGTMRVVNRLTVAPSA